MMSMCTSWLIAHLMPIFLQPYLNCLELRIDHLSTFCLSGSRITRLVP